MLRTVLILAALLLGPAAPAAEPEWRWADEEEVLLTSFDYEPPSLRLEAGKPVKLRFYNSGGGTLVFEAKDFFRSARVRAGDDAEAVAEGRIRLRPGDAVTVALVPAPGRYHVRSSNILHRLLGMTGEIVVE